MFKWKDYLDLAEKLINDNINILSNEACWRSAVSRAYYACFHKSRDFAYNHGFLPPPRRELGKEHRAIPQFLKLQSNVNIQNAGINLERLLNNRIDCDYKHFVKNIKSLAKLSVLMAGKVFQNIP